MAAKVEANAAKTARIHTNNSEHKAKLKQKTERTPSLYSGMLHGGSILVASVKRRRPTTWKAKQSMRNNVKSRNEHQRRKGDGIMCLGCCLAGALEILMQVVMIVTTAGRVHSCSGWSLMCSGPILNYCVNCFNWSRRCALQWPEHLLTHGSPSAAVQRHLQKK